jgi:predicted Zn-dependent protease
MARAGYNPMDLARMFQTLEKREGTGDDWLRNHPNPGKRQERISREAKNLKIAGGRRGSQSSKFAQIQSSLKGMPSARTISQIKKSGNTNPNAKSSAARHAGDFSHSNKC